MSGKNIHFEDFINDLDLSEFDCVLLNISFL